MAYKMTGVQTWQNMPEFIHLPSNSARQADYNGKETELKYHGYSIKEMTDEIAMVELKLRQNYSLWSREAEDFLSLVHEHIKKGNNTPKNATFILDSIVEKRIEELLTPVNAHNPGNCLYTRDANGFNTDEQIEWLMVKSSNISFSVAYQWLADNRRDWGQTEDEFSRNDGARDVNGDHHSEVVKGC